MARNVLEAANRLRNASPEELQMIAKHDWDMIREVAAIAFAYFPKPETAAEGEFKAMLAAQDSES